MEHHQFPRKPAVVDGMPLSWNLDPSLMPSQGARELLLKERELPVEVSTDVSLRPKILDACGMTCTFCHNEGTPVAADNSRGDNLTAAGPSGRVSVFLPLNGVNFVPGRMRVDERYMAAMGEVCRAVGIEEVHLTGGEPTLHPELPQIIARAKGQGLGVKMTSNGENAPKVLEECAAAGLDQVVFSIFGTTPEELAQVQHERFRNIRLAERKIASLRQAIGMADSLGVKVAANIVMPDATHQDRIARVLDEFSPNLSLRILNSLDDGEESYHAIYDVLDKLGAEPRLLKVTAGSSSARVEYALPNGRTIYFKQIRRARFDKVCDGCEVDARGKCEEGYYGLRLYVDTDNRYMVGFCIQRMDLAVPVEEFVSSDIPQLIKDYREYEADNLKAVFRDKLVAA